MEIERKFLIKEKTKDYYSPFNLEELKKEIKSKGKKISQHYLPVEISGEIIKELGFKINFIPNEIRIRKIENNFYITLKSKGAMKRHEFEKSISSEIFEILKTLKTKSIEKLRLEKRYSGRKIEFDYLPKYSLITAEIEFENEYMAKNFKTRMNEITGRNKYKSQNLAK